MRSSHSAENQIAIRSQPAEEHQGTTRSGKWVSDGYRQQTKQASSDRDRIDAGYARLNQSRVELEARNTHLISDKKGLERPVHRVNLEIATLRERMKTVQSALTESETGANCLAENLKMTNANCTDRPEDTKAQLDAARLQTLDWQRRFQVLQTAYTKLEAQLAELPIKTQ